MKLSTTIVVLGLVLTFLSLIACNQAAGPEGTALSFWSVERDDWGDEIYKGDEPTLMIVTDQEDLPILAPLISPEARQALEDIDFNEAIVVGVFYGYKGIGPYEVIVNRVTQQRSVINIYATFIGPGMIFSEGETSAYEIVVIERPEQSGTTSFVFNLIVDRQKEHS